jgi:uncharacterized protein with HEPN domain
LTAWPGPADYRIIAAHRYHQVDVQIVEDIVRTHLPDLLQQIDQMLADGI